MTTQDGWPTTAELIERLSARGLDVSIDQLKRWSRSGLVSRSAQVFETGQAGSVTRWPSEAERQVVLLTSFARRFRRLDDLLVALWWHGADVEPTKLVTDLVRRYEGLVAFRSRADEASLDNLAAGNALRGLDPPLLRAFRRSGHEVADRTSFVWAISALAAGIPFAVDGPDVVDGERSLREILAAGLGLDRFAQELRSVGEAVNEDDLVDDVVDLVDLIDDMLRTALDFLKVASWEELCAARDAARRLADLAVVAEAASALDPRSGVGSVGQLVCGDDPDAWLSSLLVVLWFRGEAPVALDHVSAALSEAAPKAHAFREVVANVPGFAEALAEAQGDSQRLVHLLEERPHVRAALAEYLGTNPHVGEALGL